MSDTFERDGSNVRVTAKAGEILVVLGWKGEGEASKVSVEDGSSSYPADRDLTAYRLVPVANWPVGPCLPNFEDCPIPPAPIPPRPPPPFAELEVVFVRGPGMGGGIPGMPGGPGLPPGGPGGRRPPHT